MISQIFVTAMIKCPNQSGLRVFQTKSRGYICYQNIVCPSQSKLSEWRKCPRVRVSIVFINFVLFQRLPMNYKQDLTMRLNLRRNQRKQFCFCSLSVHPMSHRESVTLTYFVYFVPLSLIRPRCIKSWLETTQTVTIMNECEGLTLSNPAGLN